MANYKNLEDMYKEFMKDAKKAFQEVVPPIMTEVHKEAIEIEVYAKYSPTMYDRRNGSDGSLSDEKNFIYDFDIKGNSIFITLYNETKGNPNEPNNQSNTFIDKIIVTGDGYSWKNSGIARMGIKRDFYLVTEQIMASDEIRNKIIKELNKKGFKVW